MLKMNSINKKINNILTVFLIKTLLKYTYRFEIGGH
jgi:hypothetical protein